MVALLDAAGSPFAAYRYDAWGNPQGVGNLGTGVWSQSTSLINATLAAAITARQPLRYAGYAYDEESSLYYLSARYYDPATRQFTSKDPAKADGEESAYQYAGGDPVGRVDPSGASAMAAAVAAGGLAWVPGVGWFFVGVAATVVIAYGISTFAGGSSDQKLWEGTLDGWKLRIAVRKMDKGNKGRVHAHWQKGKAKGSVNKDGSKHHSKEPNKPPTKKIRDKLKEFKFNV